MEWKKAAKACVKDISNPYPLMYILVSTGEAYEKVKLLVPLEEQLESLEGPVSKQVAGQLLALYFRQLLNKEPISLDMRLSQFYLTAENKLVWSKKGIHHSFDQAFLDSLIGTYEGFYGDDDSKMSDCLAKLGLWNPDSSEETKALGIELLKQHFGDTGAAKFDLPKFSSSFHELFTYLLKNKVTLSHEFLFLGVYLLTLYHGLSKLNCSLDVQGIWDKTSQA